MAWQLIYTSSPRGLVSGQSGFCTVARSADMREALVTMLERFSSYHHLAVGASETKVNPVISACRVVDIRGTRYHVLTRIQDAGLDFTNRTNHLAQHLVFESHELATLPPPAVILRDWPGWLSKWSGEPRYLGPEDLVGFEGIASCQDLPAAHWQATSGDAGSAAALVEPPMSSGTWLVTEVGDERALLNLFAEASQLANADGRSPERVWRYSFTTFFQGEDNPSDFRWRGCWCNSKGHQAGLRQPDTVFEPAAIKAPNSELATIARNGVTLAPAPSAPTTPEAEVPAAARSDFSGFKAAPAAPSAPPPSIPAEVRATASRPAPRSTPAAPVFRRNVSREEEKEGGGLKAVLIGVVILAIVIGVVGLIFANRGDDRPEVAVDTSPPTRATDAPLTNAVLPAAASDPVEPTPAAAEPEAIASIPESVEKELWGGMLPKEPSLVIAAPFSESLSLDPGAMPALKTLGEKLGITIFGNQVLCDFQTAGNPQVRPGAVSASLSPASLRLSEGATSLSLTFEGATTSAMKIQAKSNVPEMESWIAVKVRASEGNLFAPTRMLWIGEGKAIQTQYNDWKVGDRRLALDGGLTNRLGHLSWATSDAEVRWCLFLSGRPQQAGQYARKYQAWNRPWFDFGAFQSKAIEDSNSLQSELEDLEKRLENQEKTFGKNIKLDMGVVMELSETHPLATFEGFYRTKRNADGTIPPEVWVDYLVALLKDKLTALSLPPLEDAIQNLERPGARTETLRGFRDFLVAQGFQKAGAINSERFFFQVYRRLTDLERKAELQRDIAANKVWMQILPSNTEEMPSIGLYLAPPGQAPFELVRFADKLEDDFQ